MPNKFKKRSYEAELMDAPRIPKNLLIRNLHELDFLNRWLGGHSVTLKGLNKLITDTTKLYHIVDLGCGSGDLLKYVAQWARKRKYKINLTGVDLNADAISFLKEHCTSYPEIKGIASDYRDFLKSSGNVDIVLCSLFCHHLTDDELRKLFGILKENVTIGFVINDLQRSRLAYTGAWLMTRLLNGSILAKNDGPLSVLRGFKRKEIEALLQKVQISYSIKWQWAFRYLIVAKTNHQ